METAMVVSIIAACVSVILTLYNAWNARYIEKTKNIIAREKETSRYVEPLARSAFDLQSRIYSISKKSFMSYLQSSSSRDRDYAIHNTTFVVAQYFCWCELFRRDVQFISLDEGSSVQKIFKIQDDIARIWSTDSIDGPLRIFSGEQRAIGEALVQRNGGVNECMGYGEFLNRFSSGENTLIESVSRDVSSLKSIPPGTEERLKKLQNTLVDLVYSIDSRGVRFSANSLEKM